jgi:hypothetical protein
VLNELNKSPASFLKASVRRYLTSNQLQLVSLTDEEKRFTTNLPGSLGPGELETVAYAKFHAGIVLSNESRVAHWCGQIGIKYIQLPAILRRLWETDILTVDEVKSMILLLQERDRMGFNSTLLAAIFDI